MLPFAVEAAAMNVNPLIVTKPPDDEDTFSASAVDNVTIVLSWQETMPFDPPLGFPLPVQLVAPVIVSALLPGVVTGLDHVADPADTLIVSPDEALLMQFCKLDESGVDDQFGLEPLHDACAGSCQNARSKPINSSFLISFAFLVWVVFVVVAGSLSNI